MMENFFIYLAKSCGLLGVFYIVFKLLLSKETFFEAHRLFLVGGIFTAILLPFITLKKIIWVEAPSFQNIDFSTFEYTEVITPEVTDWWQIAGIIYIIGVAFFSIRFVVQLFSLHNLFKKCSVTKQGEFTFAITDENVSPFSFFNTLFYNPTMHTKEELKAILIHEKIHAKQQHSLDILLAHVLTIFQWMNPFSWMYKRTIAQNLEYIADKNSANSIADKKGYQYLLLHQSGQVAPKTTIINPFFNSLIKKRIVMLNQQQSNKINLVKYSLILPLLGVFLFAFNTKTIAQVKEQESSDSKWSFEITATTFGIPIDKNSTDEELIAFSKHIEDSITLKFSKIKRNRKGEITKIKATYKTEDGQSGEYVISGNNPIDGFLFYIDSDNEGNRLNIGFIALNEKNNIFVVTGNDSSSIKNSTNFIVNSIQNVDFDIDDLPSDSLLNALNMQSIKKVKMIKNEDGKTGKIIISEKNFKDLNTVDKIELPASSQNFNWNDINQEEQPLIVIDGEITENSALKNLNPDIIESLSVLKDKSATEVYGEKGKNGVIIITTKNKKKATDLFQNASDKALYIIDGEMIEGNLVTSGLKPDDIGSMMILKMKSAIELYGDKGKNGVIQIITKKGKKEMDKTINSLENALFIVNGKIKDASFDIDKVKPNNIESINILKDKAAIKKYGEQAKNGVIEVTTKKGPWIIGESIEFVSISGSGDINSKTPDNFYVEAKKITKDGKTYISGKVFTSDSPLPGVTIVLKDSKSGTITNFDGQFTIAAEDGQTLLFQFIGFPNAELKITDDKNYSISTTSKK
ncbi:MAG: carboxypeptidase-like regulatory domain-containing protein [Cellulophaga sp.]|nr:carboxypeptidase-like regulatory domain-containing protein [Cellulophaga sp.]